MRVRRENDVALKEWAAIEDALAAGRLTVLVRKGGIYEKRGGFEVENRAFWIFPTGWHQNEHELSSTFRAHLGDTPRFAPGEIPLRVHCMVEDALRVESLAALERLGELQPFSADTLRARFEYRGRRISTCSSPERTSFPRRRSSPTLPATTAASRGSASTRPYPPRPRNRCSAMRSSPGCARRCWSDWKAEATARSSAR